MLSPWDKDMPLWDPCCGTGTLLIEAAYWRSHRAPGLNRNFACESWPDFPKKKMDGIRKEAEAQFDPAKIGMIGGSDIDPEALTLCKRHIKQAGLAGKITVMQKDVRELQLEAASPFFLLNPPYGERLSDKKKCEALYRDLRALSDRHPGSRMGVITAHTGFERCYGKRVISERHRHRYEFNNDYRAPMEEAGLTLSGISPDGTLVETVELSDRPFHVGVQYHPEFKSRPNKPHPLFLGFVGAAFDRIEKA